MADPFKRVRPRPFDLGQRVDTLDGIRVGNTYYFTDFSTPYIKLRLTHVEPANPDGSVFIRGVPTEVTGIRFDHFLGVYPGNPNAYPQLFLVNPKPIQRSVGEVFTKKTTLSSKPGSGPANIVRSYLGVQPVSGGKKKRSKKTRKYKRRV
jgi:hypothetical protein